eukprot:96453-Prorocentrum_minimum.AAC.1
MSVGFLNPTTRVPWPTTRVPWPTARIPWPTARVPWPTEKRTSAVEGVPLEVFLTAGSFSVSNRTSRT